MSTTRIRKLETEAQLSTLQIGDIVPVQLADTSFYGYLYFAGYVTEPFTFKNQLQFFGVRNGEREIFYVSPEKLTVWDGMVRQKTHLSKELLGGDVTVFPAEVSSARIFQQAYEALQQIQREQE